MIKNAAVNAGHARYAGWTPESGRSLGEEMATHSSTPVFSPGEFHGQMSLAGYGPWATESDSTE